MYAACGDGMKARLVRLSSTNTNLRTREVEGEYFVPPKVGDRFKLTGESLSFTGGIRLIDTSPVVVIVQDTEKLIIFKTENSTYELHCL